MMRGLVTDKEGKRGEGGARGAKQGTIGRCLDHASGVYRSELPSKQPLWNRGG